MLESIQKKERNRLNVDAKFQPLFDPKSIAFIGASNAVGKWGFIVLRNLINGGYTGKIFPVNPNEKHVQGITAYPGIRELPSVPDLAVIVIPPDAVPKAIDECAAKGIRAGLVITAGFAEVGAHGEKLQAEMVERAAKGGMILVGPNCNGILRPSKKLFPQMPMVFPPDGKISIVSQSGNVATSLSQRAIKTGFGIGIAVSSGNEADLHCEDFFDFMANDPGTEVIISYIEGFRNGRRFFETAKDVALKKPIVILKAGGTEAGAKAAMSHTASLAGMDAAFQGACRQAGIIRARNMEDLFNIGMGFINQPPARGNKTAIVTMGGGWGVLAADAAARYGLDVVTLSEKTLSALDEILPPWWNPGNPVDMVAGNIEGALMKSLEILFKAPETDCIILLGIMGFIKIRPISPDTSAEKIEAHILDTLDQLSQAADTVKEMSHYYRKPLITATEIPFAVGDMEERIFYRLGRKGYPVFRTPDTAARIMSCMVEYSTFIRKH
ncbi:MAG: CoA-binding protein [Desulfobacterales bacterium]